MNRRLRIRTRMAVAASVAVAGVVVLCAAGAYWISSREVYRSLDLGLVREATALQLRIASGQDPGIGGECAYLSSPACYEVLRKAGDRSSVLPTPGVVTEVLEGRHGPGFIDIELAGTEGRMYVTPLPKGGALLVAVRSDQQIRALERIKRLLVALCAAGIGAAAVLGYAVARYSLRPVAALSREAESVAAQRDPKRRVSEAGSDELATLGASINSMLRELDDSIESQKRLVSDASHELRTPLTGIIANAELLARGDRLSDEQRVRVRAGLARSTENMRALIDDIVDLARGAEPTSATEPVALDRIAHAVADTARAHWPEIEFDCRTTPYSFDGNPARLAKLIANLVDNAAAFSPRGGRVEITLSGNTLRVRDHGPGIDPRDLPRVFERFYRSPANRATAGSGLGLAMAQQIANAHHATLTAANAPDGGAILTLHLPTSD
ncbi:ATP-binding protein [Nocardia sp. NPDC052566]|uniref:HAMP domain-containing sensor histidine kinase n=1 Tax=Nocardia sp. NPDC052566 TaxID=3364330 RepID=UPI0037CBD1A6